MKRESIITKEKNFCLICGRLKTEDHHLICGTSGRAIADRDALTIPLCDTCHKTLHGGPGVIIGKMLGQACWEKNEVAAGKTEEEARKKFMGRYGKSWL